VQARGRGLVRKHRAP